MEQKAPMVAVGADPSACRQHALARYLGQDADGAERYGMELQATLQLEVYSPGRRAGALCERAAAQVVDVFLGGIEGLYSGDLELGRTAYDARTDCFRCAVRAPLTLSSPRRMRLRVCSSCTARRRPCRSTAGTPCSRVC